MYWFLEFYCHCFRLADRMDRINMQTSLRMTPNNSSGVSPSLALCEDIASFGFDVAFT